MANVKSVFFFCLVLVLMLSFVCGQNVVSPCPGLFDYIRDESGISGRIVLQPGSPVSQLAVRVNFTVPLRLSNYYGRLKVENEMFALRRYNQGSPMTLRVYFPVTSPLPRLIWLGVNGKTLCSGPGDVLQSNQYLSTFSLQLTMATGEGSQVFFQNQPGNDFESDFGDNQGDDNTGNNIAYYTERTVPPVVTRYPNKPIIQQTPKPKNPATQVYYYPEEPSNQTPRPAVPNPVNRRPSPSNSNECGVVDPKIALIIKGQPYNRGDVPWLVAIYRNIKNNLSFICGGTLVSDRHVITAAHCMKISTKVTPFKDIVVKLGIYDLNAWEDEFTLTRTLIGARLHESYNSSTLENDILVLTLRLPVQFNEYIKPACLWSGDPSLDRIVDNYGLVAGWGEKDSGGPDAGIPTKVYVPVVKTETCRAKNTAFHKLTSSKTLCAGDLNGAGPCKGDSGGGLYLQHEGKWRLRGIVSISLQNDDGTCDLFEYLVLTDTAQYLPWIRRILQAQD